MIEFRRKPDMEAVSMAPRQSQDLSSELDPDKTPRAMSELAMNPGMCTYVVHSVQFTLSNFEIRHDVNRSRLRASL